LKITCAVVLGLPLIFLANLAVRADDLAVADSPYAAIATRNAFNLVANPATAAPETTPAPSFKIIPNGTICLFGQPQVLFKVATVTHPGQRPQAQSYLMSVGDCADGITVTKIVQSGRTITFDNHGWVEIIPLANAEDANGPSAEPDSLISNPSLNQPVRQRIASQSAATSDSGYISAPASVATDSTSLLPASGAHAGTTLEKAQAKLSSILNDPNHLTPEAQIVMMEAQRQQLQQQGDPTAPLLPPTELTQQTTANASSDEQSLASDPNSSIASTER